MLKAENMKLQTHKELKELVAELLAEQEELRLVRYVHWCFERSKSSAPLSFNTPSTLASSVHVARAMTL